MSGSEPDPAEDGGRQIAFRRRFILSRTAMGRTAATSRFVNRCPASRIECAPTQELSRILSDP